MDTLKSMQEEFTGEQSWKAPSPGMSERGQVSPQKAAGLRSHWDTPPEQSADPSYQTAQMHDGDNHLGTL